jgi:putative ABC transport system ATP-binding protein
MKPILQTENLSKIYKIGKVETQALRGVSIAIEPGEFVAIMGQSGCGKSTLLHLLGGLLSPTSGTIIIDGEDLSKVSDAQRTDIRRRKIGFVFNDSIFSRL